MMSRSRCLSCSPAFALSGVILAARGGLGAGPAEVLLKRVPPDAAVTIAVEDLKGTTRSLLDSRLIADLKRLPSVQGWLNSDKFRVFRSGMNDVEMGLGESIATLRDDLFGEAFVLCLHVPPAKPIEAARGLLLLRVPNSALLDRLMTRLNEGQKAGGDLIDVSEHKHGTTTYYVRTFRPGGREREYYVSLADRIFAWSNSEELIHGVIDRGSGEAKGLADAPGYRSVRDGLPERALVRVFVDPRFVTRALTEPDRSAKPDDAQFLALATRYLGAFTYVGAALEWREGLVLHARGALDAATLTPAMKRWGERTDAPTPALQRVPKSALVLLSASLDASWVFDTLFDIASEKDRAKMDNLHVVLDGILLGRSAREEVVPRLGPSVVAYLDRPAPDVERPIRQMPLVVSVEVEKTAAGARAWEAIGNALRTLLACHALDPKNGGGVLQFQSQVLEVGTVSALRPTSPFAFSAGVGKVVLGTTADAVARALLAQSTNAGPSRFDAIRAALFPKASSFACADLKAIHEFARQARPALVRGLSHRQNVPEQAAARDLDDALALIGLFDAAYLTSTIEPGFRAIDCSLGLVRLPRPDATPAVTSP